MTRKIDNLHLETNLIDWMAQLSSEYLFTSFLELFSQDGLYIVNSNQQVIHWSIGAAKATGFESNAMLGRSCPTQLSITEKSPSHQTINLTQASGGECQIQKTIRLLFDSNNQFYGGIGLLQSQLNGSTPSKHQAASLLVKNNFQGILSRSPAMQGVFQIIQNAAETTATVLVRGESGSGKELVAKAIHDLSSRRNAPFLAINCAALSSNLLESELFGHVRGAFTGAIKDHNGLFQRSHGGTLFLDEVAELPLDLQAKLLRVLQERNYIPVGGDRSIDVDVRIVAATHRSLREEVKTGRFREDLMYRLRVVPIFIPPLRERREDIGLLIWHFIQQHNNENFRHIDKIDPPAMKVLLDYQWPGNIRELHNVVEYAFAVGRGSTLRLSELPPEFRESPVINQLKLRPKQTKNLSVDQEMLAIKQALHQNHGNINEAAEQLNMSRATFWRKRKLHGI
jgi:transcriptional regulator with PAS, ATPase and Fis domain